MTSCRLVATSTRSSNSLKDQHDEDGCSHPGARKWIEDYLDRHEGWGDLQKMEISHTRDPYAPCSCKVTNLLRSVICKEQFVVRGNFVSSMSSYKRGLRKMEDLLKCTGPLSIRELLKILRKALTESEGVAIGRSREELKKTICRESTIFTREYSTGVVMLSGIHTGLNEYCSHSGIIHWIEQYLKRHSGLGTIEEMNRVRQELPPNKQSCRCAIRSLLGLPHIAKCFHRKDDFVFIKSYYQSGLKKVADILQEKGSQKLNELLQILKEKSALSVTELRAVGNDQVSLLDTINKERGFFDPVSESNVVNLKVSSKHCNHDCVYNWIKNYLDDHNGFATVGELTTAYARITTLDDRLTCYCDISRIIFDSKFPFRVQGNQVCRGSSLQTPYDKGIQKMKKFLARTGPQPVGILLDMLKHEKIMTDREERATGRNKKELTYTISREPKVFKFVSPPGIVMLRDTPQEDSNQVTKVVEYLERYLRTCKFATAKVLLKEVVRHKSMATGCISGIKSLRRLLASHDDHFVIHGDGKISLTKSRQRKLSETTKSSVSKTQYGICGILFKKAVNDAHSGQSAGKTVKTEPNDSSTEDVNSSESKLSNMSDKKSNYDTLSNNKDKESVEQAPSGASSKDLDEGLRFIEKLLKTNGPMVVQDIHTSIVADAKLNKAIRSTLGRTPDELLSILLLQKDTFHVIPPSDLIVLCHTRQMSLNPWTSGLDKLQAYLTDRRTFHELKEFIKTKLSAKERQVIGDTKKKVKRMLAHCQDLFENRSGQISVKCVQGKCSSKRKQKSSRCLEERKNTHIRYLEDFEGSQELKNDENPCKKPKLGSLIQTEGSDAAPQAQLAASAVVPQVQPGLNDVASQFQALVRAVTPHVQPTVSAVAPKVSSAINAALRQAQAAKSVMNECTIQAVSNPLEHKIQTVDVQVINTTDEWIQACHSLFETSSSVVGIDCDSRWFVLRLWTGQVIATKIQSFLPSTVINPPSTSSGSSDHVEVYAETSTKLLGKGGQCVISKKSKDILHHVSLLLSSPSTLKVVYDIERICSILSQVFLIRIQNVFDIKVASQLIRRTPTSPWLPEGVPFTRLCELYGVTPAAAVKVCFQTQGEVSATEEVRLKNMAVMTCTLIPHFLKKMFKNMKVELLTEHNCIVDEICDTWTGIKKPSPAPSGPRVGYSQNAQGPIVQTSGCLSNIPDVPLFQRQQSSSASTQMPLSQSSHHAGYSKTAQGPIFQPQDICQPKFHYAPLRQSQHMPLTGIQRPNPNPSVLSLKSRCFPQEQAVSSATQVLNSIPSVRVHQNVKGPIVKSITSPATNLLRTASPFQELMGTQSSSIPPLQHHTQKPNPHPETKSLPSCDPWVQNSEYGCHVHVPRFNAASDWNAPKVKQRKISVATQKPTSHPT